MKKYINPNKDQWKQLCERPAVQNEQLFETVQQVFTEVEQYGDDAIRKYTHFYDKVDLTNFSVTKEEVSSAREQLSDELVSAIQTAKANIEKFHNSQLPEKQLVETMPGVSCWQEYRGIEKVGIYIPGGTAPLFSSVLMLAIPAKLAGCEQIVLCTPPGIDGEVNPAILFAAELCGVDLIFKVGGIQAVAAMTFGTASIPDVYTIVGPGNQYVTAAKQLAQLKGVKIDMPAGPSELLVLADKAANPAFVAADLLSQAEHGVDSQVICVVDSKTIGDNIQTEVNFQLEKLPRKEIAVKALQNSKLIVLQSREKQIDFINEYAPEHLIINLEEAGSFVSSIKNAGSIFLGPYTPESVGDYASGTNHTLPTNGFARMYNGVNVDTFLKKITVQQLSESGLNSLSDTVIKMAEAEQLQAHANAVKLRLRKEVSNEN